MTIDNLKDIYKANVALVVFMLSIVAEDKLLQLYRDKDFCPAGKNKPEQFYQKFVGEFCKDVPKENIPVFGEQAEEKKAEEKKAVSYQATTNIMANGNLIEQGKVINVEDFSEADLARLLDLGAIVKQ